MLVLGINAVLFYRFGLFTHFNVSLDLVRKDGGLRDDMNTFWSHGKLNLIVRQKFFFDLDFQFDRTNLAKRNCNIKF